MTDHYRENIDRLHDALTTAQKERPKRQNLIATTDGGLECEWARFERNAIWKEVNRIRSEQGLRPALLSSIVCAEQQAVGHSDYTKKFALYCAELTV